MRMMYEQWAYRGFLFSYLFFIYPKFYLFIYFCFKHLILFIFLSKNFISLIIIFLLYNIVLVFH